jgi:hypothetical protein
MKNRLFDLGVYLPDIRIEGEYNLQGKVLILPLLGNGPAKVHLSEYSRRVYQQNRNAESLHNSLAPQSPAPTPTPTPNSPYINQLTIRRQSVRAIHSVVTETLTKHK